MKKNKPVSKRMIFIVVWLCLIAVILAAIFIIGFDEEEEGETIKEVMLDGVLHEDNQVNFFGLSVNPGLISAYTVTLLLLIIVLLIRTLFLPRFRKIPGKAQSAVEWVVSFFSDMAGNNSPHKTGFVGAYIFSVGIYIFFSTLFELFGVQVITTGGRSVSLPAPISDINGAIAVGVTSFLVILVTGIVSRGFKGALSVLKDFSLPISMSFRLFGALLSGLLVTELVYYYVRLSFVLPVIVGVMFTCLHALIQTYVLTTLVSIFYGEAAEPPKKKEKRVKEKAEKITKGLDK